MIYCQVADDRIVAQAMALPEIDNVPGRTDFDWWMKSVMGSRSWRYVGENIMMDATRITPGTWIVFEVPSARAYMGQTMVELMSPKQFEKKYARVV